MSLLILSSVFIYSFIYSLSVLSSFWLVLLRPAVSNINNLLRKNMIIVTTQIDIQTNYTIATPYCRHHFSYSERHSCCMWQIDQVLMLLDMIDTCIFFLLHVQVASS